MAGATQLPAVDQPPLNNDLHISAVPAQTRTPFALGATMDLDGSAQGSERFRESARLIPSRSSKTGEVPRFMSPTMHWPVRLGIPLLLVLLGIALEVAMIISSKRGGFKVPPHNVLSVVSPQFLLAFFPTSLVAPIALVWREVDWDLRWIQPYVVLWRGNASAEESLLLDYIALGPFLALFRALKYKHRILFWSSLSAVVTFSFQPLAGSIFQLRQKTQVELLPGLVTNKNIIGRAPDVDQLNAFVAAAGFAEAAVFHSLPDPPFIHGGWATAEFTYPTDQGLNGTMRVNTTGIQTAPNCANPVETTLTQNSDISFNLTSKSVEGCTITVPYNPTVSETQYGVVDVPCPGDAAATDISFHPVMFWYYLNGTNGPEVKTIFCAPTVQAFRVTASTSLNDRSLFNVVKLDDQSGGVGDPLNAPPLNGHAYNGVLFDDNPNTFIQARSLAVKSGIPGAIFRFASQLENGPQSVFDRPNGFLNITTVVYTQHLALVAESVYFVDAPANDTLSAEITSIIPVLWIDLLPGQALAIFLILTGTIGLIVQVLHQRVRRHLLLAAPPGSIAAITSLTSRSGFGDLLSPFDDNATLERKLQGLRFRTDRRTGAIVSDDSSTERAAMGPDDAMLSLLGQDHSRDIASSSSSHLAYQTAIGYPPWKTPYDP